MSEQPLPVAAARSALPGGVRGSTRVWETWPSLMVYAHATQRGMRVTARLYHPTRGKNGSFETIADYSWRPREVSELAIVEWASKALARWLEGQLMPETDG